MLNRRQFLKLSLAAGAGFVIRVKADGLGGQLGGALQAEAAPAAEGLHLSDPASQPKFANLVPDAMAPGFKFVPNKGKIKVAAGMCQCVRMACKALRAFPGSDEMK